MPFLWTEHAARVGDSVTRGRFSRKIPTRNHAKPSLILERGDPKDPERGAMSKAMPLIALMLGCVTVIAGTAVASAEDEKAPAAETVLKDKGLTKNDRLFLLDEAAAIEKYGQTKAAYADYQKALNRYAAIVQYEEAV
jgi:hypothetical protein